MAQKIGIWGLGIVGKSAIAYFYTKGYQLEVFDQRILTPEEQAFLVKHAVAWCGNDQIVAFLERNEMILPSCGIDLRPYQKFAHKWLSELDLFEQECQKPIIAITGSVGKTTVTHLLSHLLRAQDKIVFTGGNIGVGLLESIEQANAADYIVIEVSSFQLELCKTFSPDFAICTNIFANHLDRHGTLENYIDAKLKILNQNPSIHTSHSLSTTPSLRLKASAGRQDERNGANPFMVSANEMSESNHKKNQLILFPISLFHQIPETIRSTQPIAFFATHIPSSQEISLLNDFHILYYLHNAKLMRNYQTKNITIFDFTELPFISYPQNVVILASALLILDYPLTNFVKILNEQELPEHRMEKVATINSIDFYNDSKSTLPESTLAAIEKIKDRPIVLFLGGISKGINRADFVKQIGNSVRFIYCFGKEAEQLKSFCDSNHIPAQSFATLDEAFAALPSLIKSNDQVLFSPAGTSYDLFAHYAERGDYFKKLVSELAKISA